MLKSYVIYTLNNLPKPENKFFVDLMNKYNLLDIFTNADGVEIIRESPREYSDVNYRLKESDGVVECMCRLPDFMGYRVYYRPKNIVGLALLVVFKDSEYFRVCAMWDVIYPYFNLV